MDKPEPLTPLALAHMIAKDHRLFIVEVAEKTGSAFVVYRKSAIPGQRATRLGRRRDPGALLHLVRQLTSPRENGQ